MQLLTYIYILLSAAAPDQLFTYTIMVHGTQMVSLSRCCSSAGKERKPKREKSHGKGEALPVCSVGQVVYVCCEEGQTAISNSSKAVLGIL